MKLHCTYLEIKNAPCSTLQCYQFKAHADQVTCSALLFFKPDINCPIPQFGKLQTIVFLTSLRKRWCLLSPLAFISQLWQPIYTANNATSGGVYT